MISKASKTKPWVDPDDAPEVTDEMLDRAEISIGNVVLRRGRPPGQTKSQVTLRLDNDLLASYRKTGSGWQSRLNADLRKLRKIG